MTVTSMSRLALVSAVTAALIVTVWAQEDDSRLVAIGDIHGAGTAVRRCCSGPVSSINRTTGRVGVPRSCRRMTTPTGVTMFVV